MGYRPRGLKESDLAVEFHEQREGGLRRKYLCQDLDLGLPASRTIRKVISVVSAAPCAVLGYGCPGQLTHVHDLVQLLLLFNFSTSLR